MQVNTKVSAKYTWISKVRQDLKEALIPIPILKKDAEYSSETLVSIIFMFVETTTIFTNSTHFITQRYTVYVTLTILIFHNFNKSYIKTP